MSRILSRVADLLLHYYVGASAYRVVLRNPWWLHLRISSPDRCGYRHIYDCSEDDVLTNLMTKSALRFDFREGVCSMGSSWNIALWASIIWILCIWFAWLSSFTWGFMLDASPSIFRGIWQNQFVLASLSLIF